MSLPALSSRVFHLRYVLLCAAAVRLCLLVWGEWQDRHLPVPYTDIDYGVFTDGALLIAGGDSPYTRSTYRYSPIIAWLLYPVVWLPWFGKLLFSSCDLLLGWLLHRLLSVRGVPSSASLRCVCVLLFNPLSLAVSTRGNGDVLHVAVLYAMLLALCTHRGLLAGVCFGVCVHLRLYPVVYLPSLLLALDQHYCCRGACRCGLAGPAWLDAPLSAVNAALSTQAAATRHRLMFAVVSGCTFLVLFAVCALLYGRPFVAESVLHHVGRIDTRHNFSLLFYPLYLSNTDSNQQSAEAGRLTSAASLLSFLPQLLLSALCSVRLSSDLPLCLLVQTALFVAFNKVVTAQYFLWYVSLLPLLLPFTRLSTAALFAVSTAWLLAELHWLSWAYQVELLGAPSFAGLHFASCCFFAVSLACTAVLIRSHRSQPLFDNGRLTLHADIDISDAGSKQQQLTEKAVT